MQPRTQVSFSRLALASALAAAVVATAMPVPPVLAQEGQIIILREVPRRPAYRQGPPAEPLAVRTGPEVDVSPAESIVHSVVGGLTQGALVSDIEAAAVSSNAPIGTNTARGAAAAARPGSLVNAARLDGARRSTSVLSRSSSGPGGVVVRATSGLGATIRNTVAPR